MTIGVLVDAPATWPAQVASALGAPAEVTTDPSYGAAILLDLRTRPRPRPDAEVLAFEVGLGGLGGLAAPGLRELALGLPTCTVRLVQLRQDGVRVLREGRLPVRGDGPADVADALLGRLVDWPRWALAAGGSARPETVPPLAQQPLPTLPRVTPLRRRLRRRASEVLLRERWTLGRCEGVTLADLVAGAPLPALRWAPEQAGVYLADPFHLPGTERLVAEQYALSGDRPATLVELAWDDGLGPRVTGPGPEDAGHLSYPSAFATSDGDLWCVPESAAAGELALWRRTGMGWVRSRTLLDVPAVDADLVEHHGRWWLFYSLEGETKDEDLHVASAESLHAPFRPHPLNPVVRDVCAARGAGRPFVVDGRLHRPAQDCATSYGGAVSLVEVTVLSETDYRQRVVRRIAPVPPYPAGLHTLNAFPGGLIIDGKREELSPAAVGAKIMRRLAGRRHG